MTLHVIFHAKEIVFKESNKNISPIEMLYYFLELIGILFLWQNV